MNNEVEIIYNKYLYTRIIVKKKIYKKKYLHITYVIYIIIEN